MRLACDDVVVLVHGTETPEALLRLLQQRLSHHRGLTLASSWLPYGPAVATLSGWLGEQLCELDANAQLHLVGAGVAGVVCCHYGQLQRDRRVVQTIAIAAPFGGLRTARATDLDIERDLAPSSHLLTSLALAARRRLGVPHLSIVASAGPHSDGEARQQALAGADVAVVRHCAQAELALHPATARITERRVLDHRLTPTSRAGRRRPIDGISPVC